MTEQEVRRRLFSFIADQGETLREAADKLGVSRPYLCRIRSGHAPVSDRILERMGIRRVVSYEPVKEGECTGK